MSISSARLIVLDKYFIENNNTDSHSMIWHLFDGQHSFMKNVNFNNKLFFSIYVLVSPKFYIEFGKILNQLIFANKKYHTLQICYYNGPVNIKTTTNLWGSIGNYVVDQYQYQANVFRISCATIKSADYIYKTLLNNQLTCCGKYNLYRPPNIDMELILANVFPTPDCQGPYVSANEQGDNKILSTEMLGEHIYVMSHHRFAMMPVYLKYMNPIVCVRVAINSDNEITCASIVSDTVNKIDTGLIINSNDYNIKMLSRIPRLSISVVMLSELMCARRYSPKEDIIAIIMIHFTFNDNDDDDLRLFWINSQVRLLNIDNVIYFFNFFCL